jgi:predicted lipoprotein with Yx(FWY)xxD motif
VKRLVLALALTALVVPALGAGAPGPTLTVRGSAYGKILFDGRGYVLYAFTKDTVGRSTCSGACAKAWPPYLVGRGALRPGAGIAARKLATTRRPDGKLQVTYAGRPLYYYVGDDGPGVIRCQNVFEYGGDWLVVRASGALVR